MKKIVSLFLALVLVLNLGITAFAEETYTIFLKTEQTTAEVGQTVYVKVGSDQANRSHITAAYIKYDPAYLEYDADASSIGTANSSFTAVKGSKNGEHYVLVSFNAMGSPADVEAGAWYTVAFKTIQAGSTTTSIMRNQVYGDAATPNKLTTIATDTVTFDIANPAAPTPVEGITLNQTELSLGVGSSSTLTATVAPEDATNKTITWSSDNEEVATVADGVVTAVAAGVATITATAEGTEISATCDVTVTPAVVASGYTIGLEQKSIPTAKGEKVTVNVKILGHSEENITVYNAYDMTIGYDKDDLTFNKDESSVPDAGGTIDVDETAGTIRITGHGEDKTFGTYVATLSFTAKNSGKQNVGITKTQIDNSDNAIAADAPEANVPADSASTEIKVAYEQKVEASEGSSGIDTGIKLPDLALPGEDYVITVPDYMDVTIKVNGKEVTPKKEGNTYTIPELDGDIQITATPKTYDVYLSADTNASVTYSSTATYGHDYTFSVSASTGYVVESVTAKIGEKTLETTYSDGKYVIPGKSITGDITITAIKKAESGTETYATITFTGEGLTDDEVVGGLTQKAKTYKDFTFQLNELEHYSYKVTIGDVVLAPNAEGVYTIPGAKITEAVVTVTIVKTVNAEAEVSVAQYIQLNGKVMWLINATAEDKVLAYGEEGTMFWSDAYNAYCWLVISDQAEAAVKTAAQLAITKAADDSDATEIVYDRDVNKSSVVDINDAQLTYDMYMARLEEGFGQVTMEKYLKADVNADKVVNSVDAAAVVATVLEK